MDDVSPSMPADPVRGWRYSDVPPQRYGLNYAKYLARGGEIDIAGIAGRYSQAERLPDPVRFFLFCHIFDQISKECLAGDFLELGVYKGDTAVLLAEAARKMDRTLYLLDTFGGFDARDFEGVDDGRASRGFIDTSLEAVRARVGTEKTVVLPGYFPDTAAGLPDHGQYCLVHIDCDLYQPILSALEYFYPRTVPGGFIVVHDYASLGWDGSERAVDDFFENRQESVVLIPDSSGSVVVRKARSNNGSDNWRRRQRVIPVGEWITPKSGGLARLIREGWSVVEDWGVWGVGASHTLNLSFNAGATSSQFNLEIDVHAPLLGDRVEFTVECEWLGGKTTQVRFSKEHNRGIRSLPIPTNQTDCTIKFLPSSAEAPATLASSSKDTRRLGLAMHRLRVTPT